MEKSIFDDDLFYGLNEFEKERIISETKEQMRREFIEVYSKNEAFYQNHVVELNKIIEEKNKSIEKLIDMLHKATK